MTMLVFSGISFITLVLDHPFIFLILVGINRDDFQSSDYPDLLSQSSGDLDVGDLDLLSQSSDALDVGDPDVDVHSQSSDDLEVDDLDLLSQSSW